MYDNDDQGNGLFAFVTYKKQSRRSSNNNTIVAERTFGGAYGTPTSQQKRMNQHTFASADQWSFWADPISDEWR